MKLHAFHKLSYGLYLIASEYKGEKTGYIANTVFQVTSKPPLLAISCHKKNESTKVIKKAGVFSVSVLKKELDVKLIGDFGFMSGSEIDKFQHVEMTTAKTGAPIVLNDAVAWFDCKVKEKVDLGTHLLIIGEVLESDLLSDDDPLSYAYYREEYKMLSPKNSPTYIDRDKLVAEELEDEGRSEIESGLDERKEADGDEMDSYVCAICGWIYDPAIGDPTMGIPPGTPFEDLPEDYRCPLCNATKNYFTKN